MKTDQKADRRRQEEAQKKPGLPQCHLESDSDEESLSRRDFIKLGMSLLGAVAAIEVGGAGLLYFRSHSLQGEFGSVVTAGRVDEFVAGSVTEFTEARFYLVRAEDGGFLAVHSRCPHLGCTVEWVADEKQFLCPCHASNFDIYGDHGSPPVSSALDTFAITIKNDFVLVDTTQVSQRTTYAPDQLTRA